jgi:hypothetical protein
MHESGRDPTSPTLAFNPSLQIASQSALDCSDAAGEVSSIYVDCISRCPEYVIQPVTHVVNTKIVQSLGDLNLLLGVEEGIGKLLTLSQSTLNDLEIGYVAQEVANGLIWVCSVRMGVGLGLDGGEARMVCKMKNQSLFSPTTIEALSVSTVGRPIGPVRSSVHMAIAIGSRLRFA